MRLALKYYSLCFLESLYFPLAIWSLYFVEKLNFSFKQSLSITSTIIITSIVFDLVGGLSADRFGRKKSAIIGSIIQIIGYTAITFVGNYYFMLLVGILIGFGLALISGSVDAILAEELGPKSKVYKRISSRGHAVEFIGRVVASYIGAYLYTINFDWPYMAIALSYFCYLILVLSVEDNFKYNKKLSQSEKLFPDRRELLNLNTGTILLAIIIGISATELLWTSYQDYFKNILDFDNNQLGIIFSLISVTSAIGSWFCLKLVDKYGYILNYLILSGLFVTNGILLLLFRNKIVVIASIIAGFGSGLIYPTCRQFFVEKSDSYNRATYLSLWSTIYGICVVVGFMLGGVLLDLQQYNILFLVSVFSIVGSVLIIIGARSKIR